ncbi:MULTISPECIES: FAD-binding oxidoreductase [Streptomyces]|uniref:FAD-binding oxidoreductase n=1 Tax=Streptomyces eurythermus TaxID=42237 RepID=A0ABW6Z4R5_9ACTN|nr:MULTISPECIES: FAD-binding protein [Streptomyces]
MTEHTTRHPAGRTVTRGDRQYADLVSGLNQRYQARPESIRLVRSTDEVVAAVQQAVDQGKRISVRSSGHCHEDFVHHPDVQMIVDMSGMSAVYHDERRGAVAVESGATNLRTYQTLYPEWGVVVPTGFCYSVAMGGHVSGGAWGPLCRLHGLVVDHLYAVEVVVVDARGRARAVVATREADDPRRDLWWAHTGGGGGNFGIATRYWFRSPDATGRDPGALLPKPTPPRRTRSRSSPTTSSTSATASASNTARSPGTRATCPPCPSSPPPAGCPGSRRYGCSAPPTASSTTPRCAPSTSPRSCGPPSPTATWTRCTSTSPATTSTTRTSACS